MFIISGLDDAKTPHGPRPLSYFSFEEQPQGASSPLRPVLPRMPCLRGHTSHLSPLVAYLLRNVDLVCLLRPGLCSVSFNLMSHFFSAENGFVGRFRQLLTAENISMHIKVRFWSFDIVLRLNRELGGV